MEIQKPQTELPLYPDIESHGSLARLYDALFLEIGSFLDCEDSPLFGRTGARVEHGNRFSQLVIAAQQRSFHFDFWQDGVCLTSFWLPEPAPIAQVLHQLLALNRNPLEVEAEFSWFRLDDKARTFLDGTQAYVDNQWQQLEEWMRNDPAFKQLHPVLVAAHAHPQLGILYPFTSLYSLQFSRCTGYPFDCPCAGIWAFPNAQPDDYQVHAWGVNADIEFKGILEDAINFIAAQLPPDCGPARRGTADD